MKIVISPAKSLNWNSENIDVNFTVPTFLQDAVKVNTSLKRFSKKKLQTLQNISPALADVNWHRNQNWLPNTDLTLCKPAVFAFNGDVYTGLDIESYPVKDLENVQSNLRILSGMYGVLKPLDLIMPYRLEMGTAIKIRQRKNLYHFWSDLVTKQLNTEMEEGEILLNLASNEYFKVLDLKRLKSPVVNVKFMDWSNGKFKVVSFFAKKARGRMARYILEQNKIDLNGVKMFDLDGYYFDEKTSNKDNLVFLNDRKNVS